MYDRKNIQVRLRPGLHDQIKERAEEKDLSINEWINKAVEHALLKGGATIKDITTKETTL